MLNATTQSGSPMDALLRADVNLVTVARPLRPALASALRRTADGREFDHSAQLDVAHPDPTPLLGDVVDPLARSFLAADIAALAAQFGAVLRRRHVQARLSVVAADGCRKLHTDYVTVRLLCTYAGLGTEWVADADLVRKNLARIDVDIETANRSVLKRPEALRACNAGDVILLKGETYEGNRGRGAVHRSPPIEAHGLRRLLLKIDEHPCGC